MKAFSKENLTKAIAAFLDFLMNLQNPSGYIANQLRYFGPVSEQTRAYIYHVLANDQEQVLRLAKYCLYRHYIRKGKNILIETEEGYAGELSMDIARELNDEFRKAAESYAHQLKAVEKKTRKKIAQKEQQRAVIRKQINLLKQENIELEAKINKNIRKIDALYSQIGDIESSIETLKEDNEDQEKDN